MESLKRKIRAFLGLDEIAQRQWEILYGIQSIDGQMRQSEETTKVILAQIAAGFKPDLRAEGEIKAESNKLGVAIINRMIAEHKARKHTTGEL